MISQIQSKTLREQAYQEIKNSILKNDLLPGETFSISSIAKLLNISDTPVREALAMLNTEGLIEYRPHKKVQVCNITELDVRQIYEVRRLLEPYAASLAVKAIPKMPELREHAKKIRDKAKEISLMPIEKINYKSSTEIDLGLNEIFLMAAGKTFFGEIFSFVLGRSLRIRTFVEAVTKGKPSGLVHTINNEHLVIIKALLEKNRDKLCVAVGEHLRQAENRTLQELKGKYSSTGGGIVDSN